MIMPRFKIPKILFVICLALPAGQVVATELSEIKERIQKLKPDVEQIDRDNRELEAEIMKLKQAYESRKAKLENYEKLDTEIAEDYKKFKDLEQSVKQKLALLEFYEKNFAPRFLEEGTTFPSLKAGTTNYSNVSIIEVLRNSVKIKHTAGFSTIPSKDLPEEIRNKFVFRPKVKDLSRIPDDLRQNRPWISERGFKAISNNK